jgi:hypothetical protein
MAGYDDRGDANDGLPGETVFAQGRIPGKTYINKTFTYPFQASQDFGKQARFVYKVFDPATEGIATLSEDGREWVVSETPAGRYQFKLLLVEEAGHVKELWIQRVPAKGSGSVKVLFNLRNEDARAFVDLIQRLPYVPIEGTDSTRIDDALLDAVFSDPDSIAELYAKNRQQFRDLISNDAESSDVIAIEHRKAQVEYFKRLLFVTDFFDAESAVGPGGPEAVWQRFFEANPWILGGSLTGQLLTSWSSNKLEQVVAGRSITGAGKRADALLRTAGAVRSIVFAEIKTHRTRLLGNEYRSGCWAPGPELTGGVAQVQGTVQRAATEIGERIEAYASDGSEVPGDHTYLLRPRSFLVVGSLRELIGVAGGPHQDKIRSFELFRRGLIEPEIITFDELLARAEWLVSQ